MQRVCQFASAYGNGKSLKVKEDEENERGTPFQRPFARDDLDVFVKPSPQAADKAKSLIYGSLPERLLPIENRTDGRFSGNPAAMDTEMLYGAWKENGDRQ